MAVHVRLMRMGAKKRPFYRIVAIDSRRPRDSKYLDNLGTYNPITSPARIDVSEEKLTKWLNDGALPSHTVASLLTQIGFTEKYEKAKRGEDVSEIAIKNVISERKKRTRKVKKAAVAAEEAKKAEAEAKAKAEQEAKAKAEEEAKAKEAPAEEAPADDAQAEDKPADE